MKLDKADAVVMLKRTDGGLNLTTTHQRTSDYARSLDLAITGLDGSRPMRYRVAANTWPNGTTDAVALLDRLGIATDTGRVKVREILKANGHTVGNDALAGAIRYRKAVHGQVAWLDHGQAQRTGVAI